MNIKIYQSKSLPGAGEIKANWPHWHPCLKTQVDSVPKGNPIVTILEMWEVWNHGCSVCKLLPVQYFLNPRLRKADFRGERFALWKSLALCIQERAVRLSKPPSAVAEEFESFRRDGHMTASRFIREHMPILRQCSR